MMANGLTRAWVDIAAAAALLFIGVLVAPLLAMLVPLLLVVAGVVLVWRRPGSPAGLWLLRAGAFLAVLTAVAAYGVHGHVTSHTHTL